MTAVVLMLVLVLAWLASTANAHSNQRLLQQQVDQAATLLRTQLAVLQTQMTDAGQVADRHGRPDGPVPPVRRPGGAEPGMSLSLWQVTGATGTAPRGAGTRAGRALSGGPDGFFPALKPTGEVTVAGIVEGARPSLAYALMPAGETGGLVVYAEVPLTRRVSIAAGRPVQRGRTWRCTWGRGPERISCCRRPRRIPIRGDTATTQVPFGNTSFTVVAASKAGLTGALSAALPWIVSAAGGVLALGSGATVEMLSRRRVIAEAAGRRQPAALPGAASIAGTLQHALLPEVPQLANVEAGARYVAGVDELEVGGDWYDVIPAPSGGACSSSATSPARACAPPPRWPRCASRCGPTCRRATTSRRW